MLLLCVDRKTIRSLPNVSFRAYILSFGKRTTFRGCIPLSSAHVRRILFSQLMEVGDLGHLRRKGIVFLLCLRLLRAPCWGIYLLGTWKLGCIPSVFPFRPFLNPVKVLVLFCLIFDLVFSLVYSLVVLEAFQILGLLVL